MKGKKTIKTDNKAVKILGTKDAPHVKTIDISNLKVSEENGLVVITGYANTKNKADRYGDIPTVLPELRNYVYELSEFLKNPVMLLDHVNKIDHVAGSFAEIIEDDIGLRVKAIFSKSVLPEIEHARTVYLEGHAKAFSIAGRWHFEDNKNKDHLTYAEIYHISPVGVGADPNALGFTSTEEPEKAQDEAPENAPKVEAVKSEVTAEQVKQTLRELLDGIQSQEKLKAAIQEVRTILDTKTQEER